MLRLRRLTRQTFVVNARHITVKESLVLIDLEIQMKKFNLGQHFTYIGFHFARFILKFPRTVLSNTTVIRNTYSELPLSRKFAIRSMERDAIENR